MVHKLDHILVHCMHICLLVCSLDPKKTALYFFSPVDPFGCKYTMRILYTVLTLAPAPLFFILGIVSWLTPTHMCSSGWMIPEMVVMWFVMALAHLTPWVLRFQQFYLTRN
jgi:hypothetical protein